MKKALLLVIVLFVSVLSTACINNLAVQELNNKANNYMQKGEYQKAICRLESSLDLDSTIFETHYNLGIAYTEAEKYVEAVEAFANAAKLKPDFADTYYSLAVAQENYAKAIIDGSLKKEEKDSQQINNDDDNSNKETKELSNEEKEQIVKLFSDSVESYKKYIETKTDITDKEDIERKIDYLQEQIEKYSSPKSE